MRKPETRRLKTELSSYQRKPVSLSYENRIPAFAGMTVLVFAFLLLISAPEAYAACANPSGAAGAVIYNTDYHVPQMCDGTTWKAMGTIPGAGGAGCSSPSGTDGTFVYNTDCSVLQYCDGTSWKAMGSLSGGPPVLTFTNNPGTEQGIPAYSDILQVSSCSASMTISSSGSPTYSPMYRICSDTLCNTEVQTWGQAASTISSGQYVQLSVEAHIIPGNTTNVTLSLGGVPSNTWTVTSCSGC